MRQKPAYCGSVTVSRIMFDNLIRLRPDNTITMARLYGLIDRYNLLTVSLLLGIARQSVDRWVAGTAQPSRSHAWLILWLSWQSSETISQMVRDRVNCVQGGIY